MSNLDEVETEPGLGEQDPAADFLAREEEVLAGLEEDTAAAADAVAADAVAASDDQVITDLLDAVPDADTVLQQMEDAGDAGDAGDAANVHAGMNGFTADDLAQFESVEPVSDEQFLDFEQNDEQMNGQDAYSAISQQDIQRAEPEKIRVWREEQRARLEKKDEEEQVKREELRELAQKELEQWYAQHTQQVENTKKNNRVAEAAFVEERDTDIPGQEWERITRLVDFNPKSSKHSKDVSRLRSILLQLKQQ